MANIANCGYVGALKFAQLNLLHCKKATFTFCRDLKEELTDISLIQEPWVKNGKIHGFGQLHDRLFYDRNGGRPRAAIHVSPSVNALMLNQFSDDDIVTVRICRSPVDGGDFVVISAYLPYDSDFPPPGPSLARVISFCEREKIPVLIGMDSNSHHKIWGSSDINRRGEGLVQYLLATDLLILNRGGKPTFQNRVRKECLDITLASRDLSDMVDSWRVTDSETFSDHKLIKFNLKGCFPNRKSYRNPRKTDWVMYRRFLEERLDTVEIVDKYFTAESLERANEEITAAIVESYEMACPLINPKPLYKNPLWSNDLDRRKKELRKVWNRAGKVNDQQDANRERYRVLLKEYNKAQMELKESSKRKFFEEANSIPSYARVHRLLAKDATAQVGSLLKPDGSFTCDSKETAMHLLQTHFPGSTEIAQVRQIELESPRLLPSREDWLFAEKLTKKGKTKWAIFKFYSYKSAGLDGVFPALLKEGIDLLLDRLRAIFKSSIALGFIPKLWEKVRVAFIPKPGKTSHSVAKDFRPISLTSFLLKTLERLLDFYVRGEVLKKFPLHVNQHAYQVGKSTDTALHQMTQKIEHMLKNGKVALGCFMDVEGAFDNTDFEVITRAAENREVKGLAVRWIVRMLSGRTVEANICGTNVKLGVTRGCPQGGILSPILWCMVIDSLLVKLNDSGFYAQGYSDDLSTLICGEFADTVGDLMRAAIKIVELWCLENKLKVNPVKTKMILFSRRRSEAVSTLGSFTLFGMEVDLKATVKYLGVIFDHKLTWIAHLEEKLNKCIGIFWLCRNAFGRTWGLSPRAIWWIFTAVVRPILSHGCIIWWPRVDVGTAKKRLDKLQRLACLCITGAKNSTSTAALEAILAIPPLDLFLKSVAFNASVNIRCNGWWSSAFSAGHSAIVNLIDDERLYMPSDQMKAEYMLDDNFEWSIPAADEWLGERRIFPPTDGIVCYTDGSKGNGLSGAGYFCDALDLQRSLSTGSLASVFQTELYAVSKLCDELIEMVSDKKVYVCTDSQSSIQAIGAPCVRSRAVLDCKVSLNELGKSNSVTIIWVPSHCGIPGNEKADRLANRGASMNFTGPEPMFGVSSTTRKSIVKEWLRNEHLTRWTKYEGAKHTKLFCKAPSKEVSEALLSLRRSDVKSVVESITNHCGLNKHLFDINCADSPTCLCGLGDETGFHVVSLCPRYRFFRKLIMGKSELIDSDLTLDSKFITNLANFLKKTRRFQ